MTIFGIEHAGFFVGAYLVATYLSTFVFIIVEFETSSGRDCTPASILVFAICWPFFVPRGLVRLLIKGWKEIY